MTEFALLGATMVGVCLLIVLIPLWRGMRSTHDRRRQANIEIYRQRCAELATEQDAGRISPAEFETEKDRLGARLLDDLEAGTEAQQADSTQGRAGPPWLASVLSVVLIAAGGAAAYGWLGDWHALGKRDLPNVDQMLRRLKGQVAMHPGDRRARMMLARVQQSRGQYAQAAHNLAVVNRASGMPNAEVLLAEAQARLAAGEDLSGRASNLFARVLQTDPHNREALWYLGLRASEAGDDQQAVAYWQRLLEQDLPSKIESMVQTRMNALDTAD